jgi:hypothetical protein
MGQDAGHAHGLARTEPPAAVTGQGAASWLSAPQHRTESGRTRTAGGAQPLALARA